MKTKTRIRAGALTANHNEMLVKAAPTGLKVKKGQGRRAANQPQ